MPDTPEVAEWLRLSMILTQAAINITGTGEIDDDTLNMMRKVRTTNAVLMAAINQVASMSPMGLQPPPPLI